MIMTDDRRFRRQERLSRARDFEAVFANRQSAAGAWIVIYGRANGLDYNRLGLVISRRLGSAVRRNRFKRLVREAFRLTKSEQPAGWDLLVLPKLPKRVRGQKTPPPAPAWTFDGMKKEMVRLVHQVAQRHRPRRPT